MDQPAFFTVPEFAEILGVSTKTVRRRLTIGTIQRAPLGGRVVRIPASELSRLAGVSPERSSAEDTSDCNSLDTYYEPITT